MGRPIRILFGTETGNAEGCAEELLEAVEAMGLSAELFDMDDYDAEDLGDEEMLFIVTSTFGNGDPPYNAHNLMELLKSDDAPAVNGLKFSVCGFGDRSYPNFAQCGKDFDSRLADLGGERVVPRMDCDIDFEVPFDEWKQQVTGWLAANVAGATAPAPAAAKKSGGLWGKVSGWLGGAKKPAEAPAQAAAPAAAAPAVKAFGRDNPFLAPVVERKLLSGAGSAKETMHYTLDLSGSDFEFEPGDSFGVFPNNPPAEVAGICEALGLDGETAVTLKNGTTLALRGALARRFDLQKVSVDLLRAISAGSGPGNEALNAGSEATAAYLRERYVVDVLADHPGASLDAQTLVGLLKALPPRLYSVSNSRKRDGASVDFVVETLRYDRNGRDCEGVASVWLADRLGTDPVPLYLSPNAAFRLPESGVDAIMIGPGTGIAPFRGFLQEREHTGDKGRNWLFFGHQHEASDWLYREELEAWSQSGVLTKADYAWSRDQDEKVYVQHRILEQGAEVWSWLEGGAHVFVCGDAKSMAPDVHAALIAVAGAHGGLDEAAAASYVDNLAKSGRYHRDVY